MTRQIVFGYVAMFLAGGIAVTVAALLIFEQRSKGLPLAAGGIASRSSFDVDLDGSRSAAFDVEPRSKGSPLAVGDDLK